MPSVLNTGGVLPVQPAAGDPRYRFRSTPREITDLSRLKEQNAQSDISKLAAAVKLLAKDVYNPPAKWFEKGEEHRRKLALAINACGEAAFTPVTTYAALTADTASAAPGVWVALPGMTQTIVTPIPARLIVTVIFRVQHDVIVAAGVDQWFGRVIVNAVEVPSGGRTTWIPGGVAGETIEVPLQCIVDVLPQTVYTVAAEHQVAGPAGPPVFIAEKGGSNNQTNMLCRVEPRVP